MKKPCFGATPLMAASLPLARVESNARLIIGVFLEAPQADPLVFVFPRALLESVMTAVGVPRTAVEALGATRLASTVTDY